MSFSRSLRSRRTNLAQFSAEELEQLRNKHRGQVAHYENELLARGRPVLHTTSCIHFERCSVSDGRLHLRIDTGIPCAHEWQRTEDPIDGIVHPRYECRHCHTSGYGCVARE